MDSRPMWKHQAVGMARCVQSDDFMLAFEMGTGKTRTMIEALRRMYASEGRLMKTLIIAPIIVCPNWKDEFKLYSKVDPKDVLVLTKSGKRRCRDLISAVGEDLSRNKIVVTNYQGLLIKDLYELIMAWRPEIVIFDESQRLKNPSSSTSKLAFKLAERTKRRYMMTGSPILNSPMDIFQQFKIMDQGKSFGKNFMSFRANYFIDENDKFKAKQTYFPKWVVNPYKLKDMMEKIDSKSMRVLKSECLDLPPLLKQKIYVDLSPQQEKAYEEMKKEFITFLETAKGPRAVVAEMAITKAMRMQQIVTGFARDEHGTDHKLDNPRLDTLKELIDDITSNDQKVIVWSCFHANYEDIRTVCNQLGVGYVELHGQIDASQRVEAMNKFRQDPSIKVCIANQRAAGLGINLVEASYSIYYSKTYSLEDQLQSEARNYRGGSEMHAKITQIDLVARGTIDELINEALDKKLKVAEYIIDKKGQL